jgi:hypothetical protein
MRICTCLVVSASLLLVSCADDPLVAKKSLAANTADVPSRLAVFEAAEPPASAELATDLDEPAGGTECVTDDGAPYIAPSC